MRLILLFIIIGLFPSDTAAQLMFKGAIKQNKTRIFRNLVQTTIIKNLSFPLTDSTEENWEDAFQALGVIRYRSLWIDNKIRLAMDSATSRQPAFQRALIDVGYTMYPEQYYQQVKSILLLTEDPKTFAMAANYMLGSSKGPGDVNFLAVKTKQQLEKNPGHPILEQLAYQLSNYGKSLVTPSLKPFFDNNYLPGQVLMISIQRRNRNYPGIVLIRDANGRFITDENGYIFSVPQLARSNSNMPGYISNGNTPEGIFRMEGFDVSRSNFIGPTPNIQLSLPFEKKPAHYFNNIQLGDSAWDFNAYKQLLPASFRDHYPAYQAWYAGKAGRSEIIAHGTALDPTYYLHQPYYPLTPTQGCLCTKEIWDEENGTRALSDQQQLVNAILKAGGAKGYAIVINLDDQPAPVSPEEITAFLNHSIK